MDYLHKLNKKDLETILNDLISDLETDCPELAEKYMCELEDYIYVISVDEAKDIVNSMKPYGEKFTYDFTVNFLKEKEITEELECIQYYLVMNSIFNDYKAFFDKYPSFSQKDVYYDFAKCFIEDLDGPKYKVEKYFMLLK